MVSPCNKIRIELAAEADGDADPTPRMLRTAPALASRLWRRTSFPRPNSSTGTALRRSSLNAMTMKNSYVASRHITRTGSDAAPRYSGRKDIGRGKCARFAPAGATVGWCVDVRVCSADPRVPAPPAGGISRWNGFASYVDDVGFSFDVGKAIWSIIAPFFDNRP